MDTSAKDHIYADARERVGPFVFDQRVADVFPDMIQRSVPGYASTLSMIGLLAARCVGECGTAYDLGCSLGAATFAMREHITADNARIIAVDNAPAMIERCREALGKLDKAPTVELHCEDIRTTSIKDASLVVLNFTLQFIPKEERIDLLKRIHAGMRSGGVLVISEKICFENEASQELLTELHHDFKRLNGYSDLEIAQKRSALENVLTPETLDAHRRRLSEAGFKHSEVWFQCLNFASLIAIA